MDVFDDAGVLAGRGDAVCEEVIYLVIVSGMKGGYPRSRAGSWGHHHALVGRVGNTEGAGEKLCTQHIEVVFDWQGACFCMEVVNTGHEVGACYYSEGLILDGLKCLDIAFTGGREPYWSCVRDDGLDEGVVGEGQGFLLVAPGCSRQGFQDVDSIVAFGYY